jgi:hypothetical protein
VNEQGSEKQRSNSWRAVAETLREKENLGEKEAESRFQRISSRSHFTREKCLFRQVFDIL